MGDSPPATPRTIDITEDTQQDKHSGKLQVIELLDTQIAHPAEKADRAKGLSSAGSLVRKYSGRSGKADRGKGLSASPPAKNVTQIEKAIGSSGKSDRVKGLSIPPSKNKKVVQIEETSERPLKAGRGECLSLLKSLEMKYIGTSGKADRGKGLSMPDPKKDAIQIEDTQVAPERAVPKDEKNLVGRNRGRIDQRTVDIGTTRKLDYGRLIPRNGHFSIIFSETLPIPLEARGYTQKHWSR